MRIDYLRGFNPFSVTRPFKVHGPDVPGIDRWRTTMPITRLRPLACAVLMLSLAACGTAPEAQRHGDAAPAPRPESPVAATPGVHEEGALPANRMPSPARPPPLASAPAPVRDQAVAKRSTMAQASVLGATGYHRLPPPPEASRGATRSSTRTASSPPPPSPSRPSPSTSIPVPMPMCGA